MNNQLSNCCKALVEVIDEDEGISFYLCSKCQKPCDLYSVSTKNKKHIQENTRYIEANYLRKVFLTDTFQIACVWENDEMIWRGEIQKIHLDKDGEAIGYSVYSY